MDKQNQFDAQEHSSRLSSQSVNLVEDQVPPALPEGKRIRKKKGSKRSLYLSEAVEQQTSLLVRWLGYGLLLSALVDYIFIIVPPQFTNPLWEFQTIGALVEHAAIPLLGLIFVFYRHKGYILKREKNLLRFLSWLSLVVGLLYLLMLPLGIADTWRIYHASNAQITAQLSQQSQQFQKIKGQLDEATTHEQLKQLVASLNPQGSLQINDPQAFKDQFLAEISQAQQNLQVQADSVRTNESQTLIKNSLKWNLGALIAGGLFILIWRLTRWARSLTKAGL